MVNNPDRQEKPLYLIQVIINKNQYCEHVRLKQVHHMEMQSMI